MCDATAFLAFRSLCLKTVGCKPSGARVMSAHQNKKISMVAAYAKGMRGDTERPVLEWDCQRIRGRIGCFTPDLDPWGYFPRSCRSFVVQMLGCSLHCKRGEVGRRLTVRRGRIGCFTPDLDPWGYFPRSCRSFVVQMLGCSLHCKRGEVGRRLTVRPLPTPFLDCLRKVPN